MRAFQKILFPVDMSSACTAAAPYVEAMVKKFHADLTLLHVLDMPGIVPDLYGYMTLMDTAAIRQASHNELNSYLKDKFEGLQVRRVMEEGDAAQGITRYAGEHGMDLIMMPTHGYGLFRSLLLGSITSKVLHDAACPVWTGVHVEEKPPASSTFANVMCAVDLNERSISTIRFAAKLAADVDAKLWLVHAVPAPEAGVERFFDRDLQIFLEEEARKTIGKMLLTAGATAQLCIGAGEVSHVVSQAALHHRADLLVTGRGHATETLGRLRTSVYSIIRQSPCPVISA